MLPQPERSPAASPALTAMAIGVGVLFWNGRSWIGWLLLVLGLAAMLLAVVTQLRLFFRPTSLGARTSSSAACPTSSCT